MSVGARWIPAGWHSVTPRLVVHDVARLVDFLKRSFGAAGDFRTDRPCQMRIGDSLVMVSGAGPRPPMPAFLYLYVADADIVYRRALKAGAVSLEAPTDTPYGDRRAMVRDPCGNVWQIATYNEERNASSGAIGKTVASRPKRPRAPAGGRARRARRN